MILRNPFASLIRDEIIFIRVHNIIKIKIHSSCDYIVMRSFPLSGVTVLHPAQQYNLLDNHLSDRQKKKNGTLIV